MKIVESKKNITLIDILKLSKRISIYYERAIQSKDIVQTLLEDHNVDSPLLDFSALVSEKSFFNKFKKVAAKKTIWVYVTEEEKYSTNSYFKHEKSLQEFFKEGDLMIAIGARAINFATQNGYPILFKSETNDLDRLANTLPALIESYYQNYGFHNLRFVLNSSKVKNSYLDVLPMESLNFNLNVKNLDLEATIDIKKMNIYPDIKEFIETEMIAYLTYIFYTLLNESALIYLKYKLVAQNQKINDLEKKFKQTKLYMLRGKRELEIEELSLLSKKKDLLHEKGETVNE